MWWLLWVAVVGVFATALLIAYLVDRRGPTGMTGARITSTLLNGLREKDATFGLETMCVGGGQGMAIIFERLN